MAHAKSTEKIGSFGIVGANWAVYLQRTAVLDERLTGIVERRVDGVDLVWRDGYSDRQTHRIGNREDVEKLRDLLTAVLDAERDWSWLGGGS